MHKFSGATGAVTALLFCLGMQTGMAQQAIDPSHFVPVEKRLSAEWNKSLWASEQKLYKGEELSTIGMPCGGIAAGQLYVRGDGTLANWWISNNAYNTGYGKDSLMNFSTALGPWKVCYQKFTPPSYIEQGFSVSVKQGNKKMVRELSKRDFDDISFIGEYPIASIRYASRSNPLPVKISMEVFSPFIPLNAKESATPGTVLKFTVTNSSASAMEVSLKGWLQNLVCLDLKNKIQANSRNRVIKGKGISGVFMDIVKPASDLADTGFFPQTHPYAGNISLSILYSNADLDADYSMEGSHHPSLTAEKRVGEKLIGSAGSSFSLKPGETRELTFLITWYFPNRPSYYYGSDLT
ncbi:MAG: GH116 family glycosyl-hydrolase, partial [Bacteroidota bacterium]|nr:GH116 family glycosyl-hydrolase [Bacteroidota bacterium]